MNEFECVELEEAHAKSIRGIALIVIAHKIAFAVCYQAGHVVQEFINDTPNNDSEQFSLKDFDFNDPDGVYIVKLCLEDDGPGDWGPDSREFSLGIAESRPATKEEWLSHCNGDWPWEDF